MSGMSEDVTVGTGTAGAVQQPAPAAAPSAPDTAPLSAERIAAVDASVARAQEAARAFRALDQEQVDRIVWAMVTAGLDAAVELAELASAETGFGVLEDKVVKNYVATEFLYDYLKDKKSVGVIEEDLQHGIELVAEPLGVVLAITPITNPTSTVLFKAIVAAKTRNAIIFRPSPHAVRCAERVVEILSAAGEAAGLPRDAIQVLPDPEHEVTHHLFDSPGIDFIWTTGGQKIVQLANSAGKPVISVGPGNAPVYLHRSADIKMAVVDILISKTFDGSVICPAEQTCVIDDAIYDETVTEFVRMGARLLTPEEGRTLADFAFEGGEKVNLAALGQAAPELATRAGVPGGAEDKVLLVELPQDLDELAAHPLIHEKLMPVLGLVRARDVEHALDVCVLVTESGGLGHTSAVYATDEDVVQRFGRVIRTGRILVNAPTAVGALGGVYNSLTPTFSLGCGTWGGSSTTDNVNYRNLLNIKTVSRRRTPPQWFRVPSDTYFNVGAIENLRDVPSRTALVVTDAFNEQRGLVDEVRRSLQASEVHVYSDITPEPGEDQIRAGAEMIDRWRPDLVVAIGGGSVMDAAKAMRLFSEMPTVTLRELSLPFLDARKRVANYPTVSHSITLVAVPTTAGTGSEVSPAAVISSGGRKVTLVDYSLVPDIAIVDPTLLPQHAAERHGRDRRRRAHPCAGSRGVDLRLAVHRRVLRPGRPADLRRATEGVRERRRHGGPDRDVERRDDRRAGVLQRVRRREPRAGARARRALRPGARPGERDHASARAALQLRAAVEIHAGTRIRRVRRPGEARDAGMGAVRRPHRGGAAQPAVRGGGRAAGHRAHAAHPEGGRHPRGRVRGGRPGSGPRRLLRPEPAHQPADAAAARARGPAAGRLPRDLTGQPPAGIRAGQDGVRARR